MFRSNPAFQLAMALLVVFYSFVLQVRWSSTAPCRLPLVVSCPRLPCVVFAPLQVRYRPYLCRAENEGVLQEHEAKCVAGSKLHSKLNATLRAVRGDTGEKKLKKRSWFTSAKSVKNMKMEAVRVVCRLSMSLFACCIFLHRSMALQAIKKHTTSTSSFLVNYNTVEAVLLASAVLVTLSGLMFESGKFNGEANAQRDTVTSLVILVIVVSIAYFLFVLSYDILTVVAPAFMLSKVKKKVVKKEEERRSSVVLTNPMIRGLSGSFDGSTDGEIGAGAGAGAGTGAGAGAGTGAGTGAGGPASAAATAAAKSMLRGAGRRRSLKRQGSTVLEMNPLMAGRGAGRGAGLTADQLKASELPVDTPPDELYVQYVQRYQDMESKLQEYRTQSRVKAARSQLTMFKSTSKAMAAGSPRRQRSTSSASKDSV